MKTKRFFLLWFGLILLFIIFSYVWGISCNNLYCDGAKKYFLSKRFYDIINALWAAISEEFLWRFIPLFITYIILHTIKYESNKKKKNITLTIVLIIIILIQAQFGVAHYNRVQENEDWILKHIIWQGTIGLLYAIAYNIVQYSSKKIFHIHWIWSHILGLITSFIVHASVNITLIIKLTF